MAADIKNREIRVQKPAQSLQAFQKNLASGKDLQTGVIKQVILGVVVVLVVVVAFFGYRLSRARGIERHEAAVSELVMAVQGDGITPVSPADMEKRMKESLPKLEALAGSAPSAEKEKTAALVATWKLMLDGKGGVVASSATPWDRLRAAQRALALGQAQEAGKLLEPLRKDAGPDAPWANLFWSCRLELDTLEGNREQGWKDVSDYRGRFKDKASAQIEGLLQSI
nr:hypothetical protein [uncultured Holophaga sp.]